MIVCKCCFSFSFSSSFPFSVARLRNNGEERENMRKKVCRLVNRRRLGEHVIVVLTRLQRTDERTNQTSHMIMMMMKAHVRNSANALPLFLCWIFLNNVVAIVYCIMRPIEIERGKEQDKSNRDETLSSSHM